MKENKNENRERNEMTSLATLKSMNHGAKIGLEMEASRQIHKQCFVFQNLFFLSFFPSLHYISSLT